MKKILYLFVFAVLLAACSSNKPKKNLRTYNNGHILVLGSKLNSNSNKEIAYDTITNEDYNECLKVLVEKDTVWFYSNLFYKNHSVILSLNFENTNSKNDVFSIDLEKYSTKEYYAVLKFSKFFDINDINEIYLLCFNLILPEPGRKSSTVDIRYYLDLDQFKHLNKK